MISANGGGDGATSEPPCVKFSAVADGDTAAEKNEEEEGKGDEEGEERLTLRLSGPPNVQLENDSLTVIIKDSGGKGTQ